jgi:hypothetical protein
MGLYKLFPEDSYNNMIYDNIMIDIPDPSDALLLENGAASQNTFYSNTLFDMDGNRINIDEESMREGSSNISNRNNN